MPADVGVLGVEPERRARVGPVPHDEKADAGRKTLEIRGELVFGVRGLDGVEGLRVLVGAGLEGRAARRAEAGIRRIRVTTPGANHVIRVSGPNPAHNARSIST